MSKSNKVLVAGASGLVGIAAIESFLAAGWDVIGISRRKPDLPSRRNFRFMPSTRGMRSALVFNPSSIASSCRRRGINDR